MVRTMARDAEDARHAGTRAEMRFAEAVLGFVVGNHFRIRQAFTAARISVSAARHYSAWRHIT